MSPEAGPSVAEARDAIRAGDRRALARAITRVESTRDDDAEYAQALLEELLPATGGSVRLGITGPPGVGKSTFIEALGLHIVGQGKKVAVLPVDPSSPVSGGSILGDKTRMERLTREPNAYIRPSPSGGSLGGVAHRTREALLLCEAAGFDVVIVETVGIGQSEVAVARMVDCFLVLLLPGGGDELQGIKKGVMELADVLLVNKADGDSAGIAETTRSEYAGAISLLRPSWPSWTPMVLKASALHGTGIPEAWDTVRAQRKALADAGHLAQKRRRQARAWMWTLIEEGFERAFRSHPEVARRVAELEGEVAEQKTTPAAGARELLELFRGEGG